MLAQPLLAAHQGAGLRFVIKGCDDENDIQ